MDINELTNRLKGYLTQTGRDVSAWGQQAVNKYTPLSDPTSNAGNNFWGSKPVQGAVNILQKQYNPQSYVQPVKSFAKGVGNMSTMGLVSKFDQQNPDRFYRAGQFAGLINPLNPVNKVMGAANVGGRVVSRFAPQATGFVAKKIIPGLLSEGLQTGGYTVAQQIAGATGIGPKVPLTKENVLPNLLVGLGARGAFSKLAPQGKAAVSNFSLPKNDIEELAKAQDILTNPSRYFPKGTKSPQVADNVMSQLKLDAEKTIRRLAQRYLPEKELAKVGDNPINLATKIYDLSKKNGLGYFDVPEPIMGFAGKNQVKPVTQGGMGDTTKYKTTVNIQDKNDLDYLRRIFSEDVVKDIQAGKTTNWQGKQYSDIGRVNIISKTPQTIDQQLAGKIKDVKLKSDTFYHGTSAENAQGILDSGFKVGSELPETTFRGGGYGRMQNSISFSETPQKASIFSTLTKDGKIIETKLKPSSKVVSIDGVQDAIDIEDYIPYLRSKNIDAVYIGGGEKELVVVNNKAISQSRVAQPYQPQTGGVGAKTELLPTKVSGGKVPEVSNTQIQAPQGVLETPSSSPIITPTQKLQSNLQELSKQKELNVSSAESAKEARSIYGDKTIKIINDFKKVANSKAFQEGDIETLRRTGKGEVVEKALQAVKEANPAIKTEEQAIEAALNLPTKSETVIKKIVLSPEDKALRINALSEQTAWEKEFGRTATPQEQSKLFNEWEKSISDYASGIKRTAGGVSVEPNYRTKVRIAVDKSTSQQKVADKQYKDWQKQVFGEANTRTTSKALDDLEKQMKSATNQGILNNADTWKDKPKVLLTRETFERNIEDVTGQDAPGIKKRLLEPIFKAEADRNKFLNKERADIKALGIAPRSKDSELLQLFGEGKISADEVKTNSVNAEKIFNAEKVLRQKYNQYLDQLNTTLTRNGYDPIPKRKDYFRHFEDLTGAFGQIGVALKAENLPTDINGLSADFKPGKTFFSAALPRLGDKTTVDAITGIDTYLEGASNQIYHTDNIQALRSFEKAIREKYTGTEHLSNFVADLGEYTNKLAGKKAMFDRAAESIVGRKIYAGANALKSQTGANMVGANVSSALTNFIPITETLATTDKISVAQAMLGIIKNVFKDDGFIDSSNFLTSRAGSDRLSLTNWQKIGKGGNWLFKVIDNFTSQLSVRSKYLEGLKKGLSETEAMSKADAWGRKTLGGRSAGEVPTLFNSKTLGFLTQFQLEVNNQLSFMGKDIPRNFDKAGAASAMAQLVIYSYIYNNIYEKLTGRRPAIDPLGVAQDTYEDYTNPNMKKGQATKNLVENVGNQLPFISALTGGRIPIGSAIPNPFAVISGDSTVKKEIIKPLFYLAPPTGGGQVKKFIEGTGAFNQGASTTDSGNVRYPVPQTAGNRIKTSLFGQYSTPEAQTYFREGRTPLSENQSALLKQGGVTYQDVINNRQQTAAENKAKDEITKNGGQTQVGNTFLYWKDGKVESVDLNFQPTPPKLVGATELDKIARSNFNGDVEKKRKDIYALWEAGKITQDEAIKQIQNLDALKAQYAAPKAKKISIKKLSVKKVKAYKVPKIKIPKLKKAKVYKLKQIKLSKIKLKRSLT